MLKFASVHTQTNRNKIADDAISESTISNAVKNYVGMERFFCVVWQFLEKITGYLCYVSQKIVKSQKIMDLFA